MITDLRQIENRIFLPANDDTFLIHLLNLEKKEILHSNLQDLYQPISLRSLVQLKTFSCMIFLRLIA